MFTSQVQQDLFRKIVCPERQYQTDALTANPETLAAAESLVNGLRNVSTFSNTEFHIPGISICPVQFRRVKLCGPEMNA